jgi:hypothetical protein
MAGLSAQGGTLRLTVFSNDDAAGRYYVIPVSVSISSPTPEVTDATGVGDLAGAKVMVPTGACASAGTMSVEFIATGNFVNPQAITGRRCQVRFQSPNYSVERNTVITGADVTATQGDIVRGNLQFQISDYYGF